VFEHQLGQQSFDRLQQAISHSRELVRINESRLTTQAAVRLELETIRLMREGQGTVGAIASLAQINEQIEGRSLMVLDTVDALADAELNIQALAASYAENISDWVKALAAKQDVYECRAFA
jgi:hypothetical protein